ncbi:MAG: VWA domain-containing protein [Spirochaetaceae bacterium]|nr:MAG: VWA domain-containing protein [Spirochaetaceae bacterium]
MTVAHPEAFWLLLVLIAVALLQWRGLVQGRRDLRLLSGHWREQDALNLHLVKWFFSSLFFNAAVLFTILGLAGFSWGQEPLEQDRRGLDIAIAADISRSMWAQDIAPSRLERSKDVMRALLQEFPDSRFSITVFKGDAVTAVPLTQDLHAVDAFIDAMDPTMYSSVGTNVEAGIRTSLRSFASGSNRHQVIVLFSDGESLEGAPLRAAREAAAVGVPIFAVGAGTEGGAPIPLPQGGQVRDPANRLVVSRVDIESLTAIAEASEGIMVRLQDADAFGRLVREIRQYEVSMTSDGFRLVPVQRYRLFLTPALILFVGYSMIRIIRWKGLF